MSCGASPLCVPHTFCQAEANKIRRWVQCSFLSPQELFIVLLKGMMLCLKNAELLLNLTSQLRNCLGFYVQKVLVLQIDWLFNIVFGSLKGTKSRPQEMQDILKPSSKTAAIATVMERWRESTFVRKKVDRFC